LVRRWTRKAPRLSLAAVFSWGVVSALLDVNEDVAKVNITLVK
jgi:hypothetical protein